MKLEINKAVLIAILSLGAFLLTSEKGFLGVFALSPIADITLKFFLKKKS